MQRLAGFSITTLAISIATTVVCAPLSCGTKEAPLSTDDGGGGPTSDSSIAAADTSTTPPNDAATKDVVTTDSATDASLDAAVDPCPIGGPADGGARASFESELTDGIWLFGEGTTFHWVRFNYTGGLQGSADYLAATSPGYFPCKGGIGLSTANASDGSAILQLPAACNNVGHRFEFLCVAPGSGVGPNASANLQATIRDIPPGAGAVPKIIKGYRYAKTQCASDMLTCSAP